MDVFGTDVQSVSGRPPAERNIGSQRLNGIKIEIKKSQDPCAEKDIVFSEFASMK